MSDKKIEWGPLSGQYVNGSLGKVGRWPLFEIIYDGTVPKGSEDVYLLKCFLPGIKSNLGHYKQKLDAEKKAESVLKYWFDRLKDK